MTELGLQWGYSLERGEGGVPLQALCKCRSTLRFEVVPLKTATSNRTGPVRAKLFSGP